MRSVDLTPLYRAGVGFDRLASMLDGMMAADQSSSYPPYNISVTGETEYRITLAVAGFTEGDIEIESREGELRIKGAKSARPESDDVRLLYRGIAERGFERRFKLADHVKVVGAALENGLLHVDLVREVPEALRPRRIEIQSTGPSRLAAE